MLLVKGATDVLPEGPAMSRSLKPRGWTLHLSVDLGFDSCIDSIAVRVPIKFQCDRTTFIFRDFARDGGKMS